MSEHTQPCSDTCNAPLASVIITTRDRPELLRTALKSLCRQLFTDFEVIVVNDGGVDPAPVLAEFATTLRIVALENEVNMGVAASRNRALDAASGRFIAYLDDDDFYYEDHLQILLVAMLKHNTAVAYSLANEAQQKREDGEYVTVSRRVSWNQEFDPQKLCEGNYIPTLCVIHEKSCLDITGKFKEHLDRHEDWDLWLRLSRHFDFIFLNLATAEYTVREGAVSLSKDTDAMGRSRLHVRLLGEYLSGMPRVAELATGVKNARTHRRFSQQESPLSIIVHCDRQSPEIAQCLSMLVEAYPDDAEIILSVDGDPGTAAWLNRSIDGDLTLIEHPERVGRVLANNYAAARATGKQLLFLSQDVMMEAKCLAAMLAAPDDAVISATLRGPDGTLLRGGAVDTEGVLRHTVAGGNVGGDADSAPDNTGLYATECAAAVCMMVEKQLFNALGGFSLRFAPGGYEDADFCLRAARDSGARTLVTKEQVLWTLPGRSAPYSPEALYGASEFASVWGKVPGWVADREFWVNPGRGLRGDTRKESAIFRQARIPHDPQK
ncbi:glycosyltransferase [Desulfovibrio sp. OttesenSCG-928-I05]|nr:glycosyltransferase [Desulfovibrio sp. OttesenSCG-928-I05]